MRPAQNRFLCRLLDRELAPGADRALFWPGSPALRALPDRSREAALFQLPPNRLKPEVLPSPRPGKTGRAPPGWPARCRMSGASTQVSRIEPFQTLASGATDFGRRCFPQGLFCAHITIDTFCLLAYKHG